MIGGGIFINTIGGGSGATGSFLGGIIDWIRRKRRRRS